MLNDDWGYYSQLSWEDQILNNVISLLRDDLLKRGAYYNVALDQAGIFNTNESLLKPIATGQNTQFFAGIKPDWIWETGVVPYEASVVTSPIQISGININGTFVPTGSYFQGTGYTVDYSRGGIYFTSPISVTGQVKCPHSFRWVSVYEQDSNIYKDMIPDWFIEPSGGNADFKRYSVYLPAIFVSVNQYNFIRGTELGNKGRFIGHELMFDIITTNPKERRKLQDVIFFLGGRNIHFYDVNSAPKPLNLYGDISGSTYNYSELVTNFPLHKWGRFGSAVDIRKINNLTLPLQRSVAKLILETDVFK